jgi:LDH2 family malate/lactate/ureidoglycolate dehydrogenase
MAECLVRTNLRAVDSHGVQLLPHYVAQIERGEIDLAARGQVLRETGCAMVFDGQHGLGQVTSPICCDHAVRLARQHGIGMVAVREANHFGAAFLWTERMAAAGMIGVAMCDASMQVPPWQGREPRLGTNPISVAVPHPSGEGWLLDMATTTIAYAKLERMMIEGKSEVPHGWALDVEGVPTNQTAAARLLMPLGGYKGSGLAVMVEILTGVLAGGEAFGTRVTGMRQAGRPTRTNQTFLAIDVSRFLPLEEFHARMEWLAAEIRSAAPARGYDEILLAGDPERRAEAERRAHGIPIPGAIWETVVEVERRYSLGE